MQGGCRRLPRGARGPLESPKRLKENLSVPRSRPAPAQPLPAGGSGLALARALPQFSRQPRSRIISREGRLPAFSSPGRDHGGGQEQAPHQGRQERRQEESVRAAGGGGDGVRRCRAGRRGGRMARMRGGWRPGGRWERAAAVMAAAGPGGERRGGGPGAAVGPAAVRARVPAQLGFPLPRRREGPRGGESPGPGCRPVGRGPRP